MNKRTINTEASLRAQDTQDENYHYQLEDGEKYILTNGEIQWLQFVSGRYSIADHIDECTEENEKGELVYKVDTFGMSEALNEDGMGCKATCLSDDSVLQAIFFYSNHND